ncbi:MAG: penicillin acylase family protein [Spirochaetes bacterium]|nr:MAG: penicillin acylase family protein [Spirochaetota bacterium]
MKPKIKKILVIVSGIVAVLVVALIISIQIFFRIRIPSYSGTETLEGLKAKAEVRTDEHGIPHIFAQSDEDLFFAQGYIIARERLFQMDLTRLAGRGELSTLLGNATVKTDKYFKTMGFYRAAQGEYTRLDPASKSIVDAYTRGVNACIASGKNLPSEYVILRAKPQPWLPADSIVCGLLMSYRLNAQREVKPLLYQIFKNTGSEVFRQLLPWVPADAPMVSSGESKPLPIARCDVPEGAPIVTVTDTHEELYLPYPMKVRASNWMIFAGSRTTTGKPVFTGSPDLEAAIPSLFYLVHLKGGAHDVLGGSIPGLPGVHAVGFNGHFAWSITVGNGDNLDYFTEKVNPDNPKQYLTENGWKEFTIIEDTIRIKDGSDFKEEKIVVRISRHGPVISEVVPGMPENCTMMWAGLQGDCGVMQCFLQLNRAKNFNEFRAALAVARGGSVHVGYADVYGNIGYQYITTFPVRKAGANPLPRPGEKGEYDWTGYVPFERQAYSLNPRKGYLGSFNQMPEPADFYATSYFFFARPYRFEQMAGAKEKFSPDEIRAMQLDTVSNVAQRWVPHIVRICKGKEGLDTYVALLEKWNCAMELESVQAALFNEFFTFLMKNPLDNRIGKKQVEELFKDLHSTIPAQWLIRYMDDNANFIWDDPVTAARETRDDQVLKAMKDGVASLTARCGANPAKWAWGRVHTMTIRHPLGKVLPFYNLDPVSYPGDDFTIHAGWYERARPFEMNSGAAIRIVVDMADLDSITVISPPGQSGHYKSRWYADQADTWAAGKQVKAHFRDAKDLKELLVLEPAAAR